jgi:hypothetical protein
VLKSSDNGSSRPNGRYQITGVGMAHPSPTYPYALDVLMDDEDADPATMRIRLQQATELALRPWQDEARNGGR